MKFQRPLQDSCEPSISGTVRRASLIWHFQCTRVISWMRSGPSWLHVLLRWWAIERTLAWLNRFRLAFLQLGCALICWHALQRWS